MKRQSNHLILLSTYHMKILHNLKLMKYQNGLQTDKKNLKYETLYPQHQQLMASLILHNCNPSITFNTQNYFVLLFHQNPQLNKTFHCILSLHQNSWPHNTFHHLHMFMWFTFLWLHTSHPNKKKKVTLNQGDLNWHFIFTPQ